ncbi:MAG: S9 family peptidase [Bacteroidales bacterium]|jgi:oligopeptidase B|nr:S9 family peptidase [Bacteroidales bacterium]
MKPPVAPKNPVTLRTAGYERIDPYFWMRERSNPQVLRHLEAENTYTAAVMADTENLQEQLFTEITSRICQEDVSVPYFHNGYFYYTRFEKNKEYPVYCRKKNINGEEQVLLDGNKMAKGHAYYEIDDYEISPDNKTLAYCVDTEGSHVYTVYFKNLETDEIYCGSIPLASGSIAWADDNRTLFCTLLDEETFRSDKLIRYRLDTGRSVTLYTEKDEAFSIGVFRSKSEKMIFLVAESNTSSEYQYLDASHPSGVFRIIQPREKNLEYHPHHYRNRFYIITNHEAKNFQLMETSVKRPSKEYWQSLVPQSDDVLLEDLEVFDDFMVLQERKNGLIHLQIIPRHGGEKHYLDFGNEEVYTADLSVNTLYDTHFLRVEYSSLTTPYSVFDYNMTTREKILRKQQEIVGGYNPHDYIARRLYARAADGTEVPMSLVYGKNVQLNGETPLLLYGYGAYGENIDPKFSISRISLLDRGFIYAIAHIRGSQYLGRDWYENGKMLHKRNTFTDFITCAEHLIALKFTDRQHLFAMGASAGGLLMGAVLNMRPDLFKGVIADVPFVDVVTTMNDKSIPLTTGEFDEWGDPENEEHYRYMISYSPYDNVQAQAYPNILVTSALNDSQVQYWEPAKWVAKLRDMKTDSNLLLFHINMDVGHGGASGRFEHYREVTLEYAFLLKLLQTTS